VSKEYPNHEQKYSDMNRHRPQGNEWDKSRYFVSREW
jgi:hypothetical protein